MYKLSVVFMVCCLVVGHAHGKKNKKPPISNSLGGMTLNMPIKNTSAWKADPDALNGQTTLTRFTMRPQTFYRDEGDYVIKLSHYQDNEGLVKRINITFAFSNVMQCHELFHDTFSTYAKIHGKPNDVGQGRQAIWPVGENNTLTWNYRCDLEAHSFEMDLKE